jgi:hypothetical protein
LAKLRRIAFDNRKWCIALQVTAVNYFNSRLQPIQQCAYSFPDTDGVNTPGDQFYYLVVLLNNWGSVNNNRNLQS